MYTMFSETIRLYDINRTFHMNDEDTKLPNLCFLPNRDGTRYFPQDQETVNIFMKTFREEGDVTLTEVRSDINVDQSVHSGTAKVEIKLDPIYGWDDPEFRDQVAPLSEIYYPALKTLDYYKYNRFSLAKEKEIESMAGEIEKAAIALFNLVNSSEFCQEAYFGWEGEKWDYTYPEFFQCKASTALLASLSSVIEDYHYELLLSTLMPRTKSMIRTIKKHQTEDRRIIIIAGAKHILPRDGSSEQHIQALAKFYRFLEKNSASAVIYSPKELDKYK